MFPPSIREEVEIPTWVGVLTCQVELNMGNILADLQLRDSAGL